MKIFMPNWVQVHFQGLYFILFRCSRYIQNKLYFFILLISDQADEPFALPKDFPDIVAGSAIIVPSSTLQDPPRLDLNGFQPNVSASLGRTAYLRCKVKNLGHKSVSKTDTYQCQLRIQLRITVFFFSNCVWDFFFQIFMQIIALRLLCKDIRRFLFFLHSQCQLQIQLRLQIFFSFFFFF